MVDTLVRKELKEAILEQGLQDTNFFNGRLLTAGDLALVQKASRRRDQLLAQAIGSGVACGLEVSLVRDATDGKPPILAITKGLAVNRSGQIIALPVNIEVALAKEKPEKIPPAGFFDICEPIQQNGKPLPGKGAYLFVARPALDYQGSAPRRGFGRDAKIEDCDRDMLVEGVQFRLVMMDVNQLENLSLATRQALTALFAQVETAGPVGLAAQNKLRNWLAHICFGTEELAKFVEDPFSRPGGISPFESYGAVDQLLEDGLIDDCDIPLALVCWTATGVKWVDMWSVRRKLVRSPLSDVWPTPASDRRLAEAEAAFLQFQEQIGLMASHPILPVQLLQVRVLDNFRYLPAAGFIPIGEVNGSRGFDPLRFFESLLTRSPVFNSLSTTSELTEPLVIEGARIQAALQQSFGFPAIELILADTPSEVLIWVYAVRENKLTIDQGNGSSPRPYLLFTSGHMPYLAEARYDVSRWNYSNFV